MKIRKLINLFLVVILPLLAIFFSYKVNDFFRVDPLVLGIIIAPIAEESIKLLFSSILHKFTKIDRRVAGLLTGLIFGLCETYLYWYYGIVGGMFLMLRWVLAVPTHTYCSALSSYKTKYLFVAIFIHMVYNITCLSAPELGYLFLFVWVNAIFCLWIVFFDTPEKAKEVERWAINWHPLIYIGMGLGTWFLVALGLSIIKFYNCVQALHIQQYCQ